MKFGKEQLSTSTTRSHLAHPMESGCRSSSSEQPEAHVGYHFSKLDFNSKYLELSKFIFLLFSLFLAKLDSNKLLFPQNSKASLTSHERSTIFVIFLFQTHSLSVVTLHGSDQSSGHIFRRQGSPVFELHFPLIWTRAEKAEDACSLASATFTQRCSETTISLVNATISEWSKKIFLLKEKRSHEFYI